MDYNSFYVSLLSNSCMNVYENNVQSSFTNLLPKTLTLNGKWNVGISEISYNPLNDNANPVNFIYIYTDIIKPRIVGSMESRCIRIIPNAFSAQHIRFGDSIEYYPVEFNTIDNISFLLNDYAGDRIKFSDNVIPIYIMLHFKRI